jgi:hypothetical protein
MKDQIEKLKDLTSELERRMPESGNWYRDEEDRLSATSNDKQKDRVRQNLETLEILSQCTDAEEFYLLKSELETAISETEEMLYDIKHN